MRDRDPDTIKPETLLTSHECAGLLQVNPSSINKWVKEKRIRCFKTPGGHRRVSAGDLVAFLSAHEMFVPLALAHLVGPPPAQLKPVSPKRAVPAAAKRRAVAR